jgi:uncharacterized membrane protein (UPF0127 family)
MEKAGRPIKAVSRPRTYYVYNVPKQAFISLGVWVADTPLKRLRGLLGRRGLRSSEGLWVVPSRGVHTIGLFFPIDLIYLDARKRVVKVVENLGPFHFAPLRWESDSVLELPARSVYESGTQVGDQLLICTQEELEMYWEQARVEQQTPPLPLRSSKAV